MLFLQHVFTFRRVYLTMSVLHTQKAHDAFLFSFAFLILSALRVKFSIKSMGIS